MRVFEALSVLPEDAKGCILAIGNFDGVHKGHRALITTARAMADAQKRPLAVLTFEPHPRKLFRPDDPPFRLTPPSKKRALLEQAGVDCLISLPFDWDFASQSAETFVESVLKNALAPAHVFVGENFRFGQLRKGSAETIEAAGIPVTGLGAVMDKNGAPYSSTAIRQALREGDVARANAILGWDWEISGTVFHGDRRGHEIGYPTANILLEDILHPAYGVYATWVRIEGEKTWRMAATNIGIRPMFEVKQGQIEAHLLDFPETDLYGKTLTVRPVSRLRGEAKFGSLDALIAQIGADCDQTRALLSVSPA